MRSLGWKCRCSLSTAPQKQLHSGSVQASPILYCIRILHKNDELSFTVEAACIIKVHGPNPGTGTSSSSYGDPELGYLEEPMLRRSLSRLDGIIFTVALIVGVQALRVPSLSA